MLTKKDPLAVKLGESIKTHRRASGMSQERLTELIDVNKNYIGCIERGEAFPSIIKLCQVANILKIKVSDIMKALD